MKKMNYYGMRKIIKKLGISDEDYKNGFNARLNTIINMGCGEGDKHFLIKALFCRMLDNEGYRFLTEYPINGRYVDVFCLDNFTAYEIETTKNNKFKSNLYKRMEKYRENYSEDYYLPTAGDCVKDFSEENIHVIFIKDLPNDFNKIIEELKKTLKKTLIKIKDSSSNEKENGK